MGILDLFRGGEPYSFQAARLVHAKPDAFPSARAGISRGEFFRQAESGSGTRVCVDSAMHRHTLRIYGVCCRLSHASAITMAPIWKVRVRLVVLRSRRVRSIRKPEPHQIE